MAWEHCSEAWLGEERMHVTGIDTIPHRSARSVTEDTATANMVSNSLMAWKGFRQQGMSRLWRFLQPGGMACGLPGSGMSRLFTDVYMVVQI